MNAVADYLAGALMRGAGELWVLFGGAFLLAWGLGWASGLVRGYGSGLLGRKYYWIVAPGVACHETGHALGCLLTGTRILEFVPFRPEGDVLGYVTHESRNGVWPKIALFFIATGPVWFGCAVVWLLARWLAGEELSAALGVLAPRPGEGGWVHAKGVWYGALWMFQTVFAPWRWGTPLFPVFAYLLFCVGSEITLSAPDLKGMWRGLAAIAGTLLVVNLIPGVSGWVESGVEALKPAAFAVHVLLFFVLLADLAFWGVLRVIWAVVKKRM